MNSVLRPAQPDVGLLRLFDANQTVAVRVNFAELLFPNHSRRETSLSRLCCHWLVICW